MKQSERLLMILRELPRGRGCSASTAGSLAERLQASARSIYRDIALLGQMGYPIAHDGDGYFMLPTDEVLSVKLTTDEVASLLYATQWAESAVPAGLRPDLESMVEKLVSMYGTRDTLVAALDQDQAIDISPSNRTAHMLWQISVWLYRLDESAGDSGRFTTPLTAMNRRQEFCIPMRSPTVAMPIIWWRTVSCGDRSGRSGSTDSGNWR